MLVCVLVFKPTIVLPCHSYLLPLVVFVSRIADLIMVHWCFKFQLELAGEFLKSEFENQLMRILIKNLFVL